MDVLQWSRHYRCFPGQGGFDLAAFVAHVLATGYDGPLSLEVFNDVFRQADPERTAVDAMRSLLCSRRRRRHAAAAARAARLRVRRARRRADAARRRRAPADRDGLPPRRPAPHQARAAVAARGHAHPRQPRRRRRPARGSPRSRSRARNRRRSAERASGCSPRCCRATAARGRPTCPRRAPDGTSVFFCRTARRRRLAARLPHRRAAGGGAGRRGGIDHVALSQPFDFFDEAALFYRSVLGLELQRRRRARHARRACAQPRARDPDRQRPLRAQRPAGRAATARELQHVALACDDVLAAAQRDARARRAAARDPGQLLRRPRGPDAARARRRSSACARLGILYDADGDGELLHFYTAMVGPGLFFEMRRAPRRLRRLRRCELAGARRRARLGGRCPCDAEAASR